MHYERLYASLHRLPSILARPCLAVLQAAMRRRNCARGVHSLAWGGNYCSYGCHTLVNKAAWRYWHAALLDGTVRTVVAVNEEMARHMIVHDAELDLLRPDHIAVHPHNIHSCTPGAIAPDPRAKLRG